MGKCWKKCLVIHENWFITEYCYLERRNTLVENTHLLCVVKYYLCLWMNQWWCSGFTAECVSAVGCHVVGMLWTSDYLWKMYVGKKTLIDRYNQINWTNMRVQRTRTKQVCAPLTTTLGRDRHPESESMQCTASSTHMFIQFYKSDYRYL